MTLSLRSRGPACAGLVLASWLAAPAPRASADGPPPPTVPRAAEPTAPATGSGLALLEPFLTPEQRAEASWLEFLGWQYVRDPSVKFVTLEPGTPGRQPDLASARRAGDLRMKVPVAVDAAVGAGFAGQLERISDWTPTRIAYHYQLADAVRRATARLSDLADRDVLKFPRLLFFQSPTYKIECPKPEWRQVERLCIAQGSASRALEAIYTRGGLVECYTGLILEVFSAQYELYGSAWFDRVFKPEDVAIGGSYDARKGQLGDLIKEELDHPVRALYLEGADQELDPGLALARVGPIAFVGVSGVLMNLVQNEGANQNLIFVSVSPEANQLLLDHGGFAYCDALLQEALGEQRSAMRPTTTGGGDSWARKEALLASPALTGIRAYVHPHGVLSLTELAKRELVHVGGRLHVRAYLHGFEWFLYRRYRNAWKDRWLAEHGFPVPPRVERPDKVVDVTAPGAGGTPPPGTPAPPAPAMR